MNMQDQEYDRLCKAIGDNYRQFQANVLAIYKRVKRCQECGSKFFPTRSDAKVCSRPECKNALAKVIKREWWRRNRSKNKGV